MYEGVRDAIRLWRRRKAFCAAVIGIMALSIGSCAAIFSIVTTVLFAPWPYPHSDRLAIIWHARGSAADVVGLSPGDYATYRDSTTAFESVAAITTRGYNLGGAGEPARVTCGRATPELPSLLGVSAWRGRWFTLSDDQASSRVVVLSHQLWRSQFGSDDGLLGGNIMLDAMPYTVIGILPPSFDFPSRGIQGASEAACWVPASFTPAELATPAFNFIVLAKLKAGISFEQAAADAAAGARRIREAYPAAVQSQVDLRARLVPLIEQAVANSRMPLWMFTGSVVVLLVIGCANVSNLLLTRLQTRQREMAVRSALGATRAALVKQLLAESVLLAVVGGACGVLLAMGILAAAVALSPGNVPRLDQAHIDWAAMGFTLACAVCAGIVGGIAPALRSRNSTATASGERAAALGLRRDRLRSALVVLEIAMAVIVLTVAGLLARSLVNLNRVPAGFDPEGVLMFSVALPATRYQSAEQIETFSRALVDRLAAIPIVSHAAASSAPPIGRTDAAVVSPTDAVSDAPPYRPAAVLTVTPGYHAAFRIAVRQGRTFESTDTMSGQPVVLVSETMARAYWPDANVVGKTMLRLGDPRPVTIVGVVADVRQAGLDRGPTPTFYAPLAQTRQPVRTMTFILRTGASIGPIAAHVRRIVAEADRSLPVFAFRSGADLVSASIAPQRFNMFVVAVFAGIALCLAVTGLYAVMAYVVAQSSREFGIRIAVGATVAGIIRLIVGRAIELIVAGLVLGTAISAGLTQLVASLLFGVQPNDPGTIGAVAALLLIVSVSAVLMPALRAARVDPTTCLRNE